MDCIAEVFDADRHVLGSDSSISLLGSQGLLKYIACCSRGGLLVCLLLVLLKIVLAKVPLPEIDGLLVSDLVLNHQVDGRLLAIIAGRLLPLLPGPALDDLLNVL